MLTAARNPSTNELDPIFYQSAVSDRDRAAYRIALNKVGFDEEIALVRLKIKYVFENQPDDTPIFIRLVKTLESLYRARFKYFGQESDLNKQHELSRLTGDPTLRGLLNPKNVRALRRVLADAPPPPSIPPQADDESSAPETVPDPAAGPSPESIPAETIPVDPSVLTPVPGTTVAGPVSESIVVVKKPFSCQPRNKHGKGHSKHKKH
jgi:hypothetical protein